MKPPVLRKSAPALRSPTASRSCRAIVLRPAVRAVARPRPIVSRPPAASAAPDPHVDYARSLTAAGGIALTCKDIDSRLRYLLLRVALWTAAMAAETMFVVREWQLHPEWLSITCLVVLTVGNWLIVGKPVEIYRRIEIRPDCLILDGCAVFWRAKMESWPAFRQDGEAFILSGIYGTRQVDFISTRRFDEFDRGPEVLAQHVADAMRQMWMRPF